MNLLYKWETRFIFSFHFQRCVFFKIKYTIFLLIFCSQVFGGSWNEVVGTALFFEPTAPVPKRCYFSEKVSKPLKYFNKTTKQLNLKRIFISEKLNPSSADEAQATDWSDNDYEDSCDPGSSTEP